MDKKLKQQIDKWFDEGNDVEIINAILEISEKEMDYEAVCLLARSYNRMGAEENDMGLLEKGEELLLSVKEEGKNDDNWYHRLGYCYTNMGRTEEALPLFQKAFEINKEDYDSLYHIGVCYESLGKVYDAKETLEKYLKVKGDDETAKNILKQCKEVISSLTLSPEELLKLIIDKWYEEANHQMIVNAVLNYPEAKRNYDILGQLAVAYNNTAKYNKAIEVLKSIESHKKEKDEHKWYYRMGYAYSRLENMEEAIKYFEKAMEIKLDYESTYEELIWIYRSIKNDKKSKETCEKLLKLNPKSDYAFYQLAWIAKGEGDIDKAKEYIEKAIEINPDDEDYNIAKNHFTAIVIDELVNKKLTGLKEKKFNDKRISFVKRVEMFWKWFEKNEDKLADMVKNIKNYNSDDITNFVSKGVEMISDKITFNVGGDFEFTFTIEGKTYLFYVLPRIINSAPKTLKNNWKFFAGNKGTEGKDFFFEMYGKKISLKDVMINVIYDEDRNLFDLTFYNKDLFELDENDCYNAFFIMMDLCIGDTMGKIYVGAVDKAEDDKEYIMPLTNLEKFIKDTLKQNEKEFIDDANECYTNYGFTPKSVDSLRYDIFTGTTVCKELINDYYNNEKYNYTELADFGVKAMYLAFKPNEDESTKDASYKRYDMEDEIAKTVFGEKGSGKESGVVLGGACGSSLLYIDLLIFDEENFAKNIKNILGKYDYNFYISDFYNGAEIFNL